MADEGLSRWRIVMGKAPEFGIARARYPGAVVEARVP
jgi:hypothetical protein